MLLSLVLLQKQHSELQLKGQLDRSRTANLVERVETCIIAADQFYGLSEIPPEVEWLVSTSASSGASVLLKWTLSIASEFGPMPCFTIERRSPRFVLVPRIMHTTGAP